MKRSRRGEEQEERGEEERRGVTEKGSKSENIWGKRQKNSPDRQKCEQ